MHFFTEPTISSQDSISAIPYGPLSGFEETDFVTGSQFNFASLTKAFACQEGMMFIQQSLFSDCVNVILKPINPLDIEFTPVKYYVYRGLLKDSFLNGTSIRAKATSESEFINDFWDNWEQYKTNTGQSGLPDPTPQSIGYDVSLSGTINAEDIFNNSSADVRAVFVKEGDWIGNFGDIFTSVFEVIVDTDHLDINLDFLRETSFPISVSSTTPSTPAEKFAQRVKREKILSFIDPAAFFGMHYDTGVKISTYISPGNKQTETKKKDVLYTDVVSKFTTKNRIYIDIRNERGYSYNFYDNYGDTNDYLLKVKAESAPDFTDDTYYTNKWPIFFDENSISPSNRINKLQIKLRIDDNIKPLLFLRNSTLRGKLRKSHFINEKKLLDGTAVDWSKAIQLKLPNTGVSPSKVNVAWHVQLQYLKQDESESDPNRVPLNQDSLDCLVPNINLPYRGGALTVFGHLQASKYTLVSGDDFSYVSRLAVYRDVDDVIFYTESEYTHNESGKVYPLASNWTKTKVTPIISSHVFPKNIKLSRVRIKDGTDDVFVITISNVNKNNKTTKKRSLFLLGLTNTELDILSNEADNLGLAQGHAVNILFLDVTPIEEKIYTKYELNVQGLTADGFVNSTVSTGVFVYSLDGQSFNSKAFGDQNQIALSLPDPGTLAPFKHIGKWEYDATVLAAESVQGIVTVDDKYTDDFIPPLSIELRGTAFYPSLSGTIDDIPYPCPVIFIVHGNGQDYKDYYKNDQVNDAIALCQHLAENGFITVSISCRFDANNPLLHVLTQPYPPFTHYFQGSGETYLYNSTETDPLSPYYEKIFIYKQGLPPRLVTKWIKGRDFSFSSSMDRIIFKEDFKYFHGMAALGRSNVLYKHMKVIKTIFNTKISNNIGILGHSRGGEAVVVAANEITNTGSPIHSALIGINNVNAVISLAPTDGYPIVTRSVSGEVTDVKHYTPTNTPYFVIYGSRDYDVSGGGFLVKNDLPTGDNLYSLGKDKLFMQTGFSIYDRANGNIKSMLFVKGATHNGFITSSNKDKQAAINDNYLTPNETLPKSGIFETDAAQKSITLAFVNAFFRMQLYNESFWSPYFKGEFIPNSVMAKNISTQFERHDQYSDVDNMSSDNWSISSSGGYVKLNGIQSQLENIIAKDEIRKLDGDTVSLLAKDGTSPYVSKGIRLYWQKSDRLTFEVTLGNVNSYTYLSFGISNSNRSLDLKDLKVGLKDSNGKEEYLDIGALHTPDIRKDTNGTGTIKEGIYKDIYGTFIYDPTKTALQTIYVSLEEYQSLGIDLANVIEIIFKFPSTGSGKVIINKIRFTN